MSDKSVNSDYVEYDDGKDYHIQTVSSQQANLFAKPSSETASFAKEGLAEQYIDRKQTFEFKFNSAQYISQPYRVENGTVPMNILEFQHSFAYDCRKLFNICVADPVTIIFASGNLIHFFNVAKNEVSFRRGSTGGGIGNIIKNQVFNHIAIAENGTNPPIIIYKWPQMIIVTVLTGGALKCYSQLAYSMDGLLLVSQSGHPDYLITVWDWQKQKIVLRCKSHGQDVYNVMFSPSVPGHITSCGSGHIKFWKMAQTFTGLKLKGELGRFGKTEICDVIGVYTMPDEKVVSGCDWGNILLWDENLIKLEVCRKNKETCHDKPITQFEYINGELVSVGMDGWIRMWFYETIDQADLSDDARFLEIQPIYEVHVSRKLQNGYENSMLMCIQKQYPDDPENTLWYAQDGNGGLWIIDLATFSNPQPPQEIFTCHAGPIIDMSTADWGSFVVTFGNDGRLHIYNYIDKKLIVVHKFNDNGTKVIWLPCKIEPTGSTIICGFQNGLIRMITVSISNANKAKNKENNYVRLIKAIRPHKDSITVMSINSSCSILITGSEDSTIFVFSINKTDSYPDIVPIGYIRTPSHATCCCWKPVEDTTLLVGCSKGDCVEVKLPNIPQSYTTVSYELVRTKCIVFKFHSVKSAIQRETVRMKKEKQKEEQIQQKLAEIEQLKIANPEIEIDEDMFFLDSVEELVLPAIYIPDIPNKVLCVEYITEKTIWLSMAGFDAGYIYEYPYPEENKAMPKEPICTTVVCDAEDTEIRSFMFYKNRKYLFFGMEFGEIRVCKLSKTDHTDLSDYWILPMHDNYNGYIPKMLPSYDRKMLLTCGHDGNLFSFTINDDEPDMEYDIPLTNDPLPLPAKNAEDIEDRDYPSIEEVIVKAEYNRIMTVAKEKKEKTLKELYTLAEVHTKIMERNRKLLKSQQIQHEEFELDPRITADLNNRLNAEMNLVHSKLAFKVERSKLALKKLMNHFVEPVTSLPFAVCKILKPNVRVHSLREQKLDPNFDTIYADVIKLLKEKQNIDMELQLIQDSNRVVSHHNTIHSIQEEELSKRTNGVVESQEVQGTESFLKNLNKSSIEYRLGDQSNQMLRRYRTRKRRLQEREHEWKMIHATEPDPSVLHVDDVAAISTAKNTIGDYKLKSSTAFTLRRDKRDTTLSKYKQLLDSRRKLHYIREDFNRKLRDVRKKKQNLQDEVTQLVHLLKRIHSEIPQKKIKPLPIIPTIDVNIEYPEKNLELEKYMSITERVKEVRLYRQSVNADQVFDSMDEEYEVLLLDETIMYIDETDSDLMMISPMELKLRTHSSLHVDMLQTLCMSDRVETIWEHEMKRSRLVRKIHEQDCILRHIQQSYEELDKTLKDMEFERLEIVAESVYLELFILTLHQEFLILKEFESVENALTNKVNEELKECILIKQNILVTNIKIDQSNKEILKLHEKIKDVTAEYIDMIQENKFFDFLRKIYRKKFKHPKVEDESLSSSSMSESSSDDNDTATTDSRDIEAIHFDESICPVGCENELYDAAFTMREKRYEYEYQIKEEQKVTETLKKENDYHARKLKIAENTLKDRENELNKFMLEKQEKLNNIDMIVILKFNQMQHLNNTGSIEKLQNCIVFDKTNLSNLYTRIGALQQDTLNLHLTHKENRTHLSRMKVDCKHMEAEIKRLRSEIKEEMINKFGQEISITALYETVLRRMIYQVKANLNDMMKNVDDEINCVKRNYNKELVILEQLIEDNTEKLSFLAILEEEQLKLRKISMKHTASKEEIACIESRYKQDLIKFKNILKKQEEQKQIFRNDIRNLSMKSRPLPPVCAKKTDVQKRIITTVCTQQISEESIDDKSDTQILPDRDEERYEGDSQLKIKHLLNRFVQISLKDGDAQEMIHNMLQELISNLFEDGNIHRIITIINDSCDYISQGLSEYNAETVNYIRKLLMETLNDITERAKFDEAYNTVDEAMLESNAMMLLKDLLSNIGVTVTQEIYDEIMQQLNMEDGKNTALKYITDNVLLEMSEKKPTLESDIADALSEICMVLRNTA